MSFIDPNSQAIDNGVSNEAAINAAIEDLMQQLGGDNSDSVAGGEDSTAASTPGNNPTVEPTNDLDPGDVLDFPGLGEGEGGEGSSLDGADSARGGAHEDGAEGIEPPAAPSSLSSIPQIDPPNTPGGTPPADSVDLNEIAKLVYGDQALTYDQAVNLFRIAQDIGQLTPQQAQALQQVLYSDPSTQPNQPAQPVQPAQLVTPQPSSPSYGGYDYTTPSTSQPSPDLPPAFQQTPYPPQPHISLPPEYADDPDLQRWVEYTNAQLSSTLTPIQEQIQYLESQIQQQAQREYEAQYNNYLTAANEAVDAWMESHPELTKAEKAFLHTQISDGLVFSFMNQGYDIPKSVNAAFDHLYWTNPELREKYIESQVQARQEEVNTGLARKKKSDALMGGGGVVSREPQPDPSNPESIQAAKIAEAKGWLQSG